MLINRKNLRNTKKKIIIKTIESNTKIMIAMTNMNKIIIKINRNRSIFQNKKMIINNIEVNTGTIFKIPKGLLTKAKFLEDCQIVCIKTVSNTSDKYNY